MEDLWKLIDILEDDIKVTAKFMVENQRTGALERSYVRAMFASLEGILFVFRKEMISSSDFDKIFSKKDRAFILERKYDKKNDVVKSEVMFPTLKESIKKNIKYYSKHRNIKDYRFPETKGWQDMLQSIKLRDALTHPKDITDLKLSNSKIEMVLRAKIWFKDEVMGQFT